MKTKRRSLADVHNTSTATAWPPKNHKCFRLNHFLCTTLLLSICAASQVYADGASSAAQAIEGISVTDGITQENMEATLDIYETANPDEINLNDANMADAILDIRVDPDSTAGDALNTIETSAIGRPDPMRPSDRTIVDAAEAIMATGETQNNNLIIPKAIITDLYLPNVPICAVLRWHYISTLAHCDAVCGGASTHQ